MRQPLNSQQARQLFSEAIQQGCKSSFDEVNILDVWGEFKRYLETPIECNGEGFVFVAAFAGKFTPPDFEYTPDYTRFHITFNRYWYENSGSHVTEFSIEFPGDQSFSKHVINMEEYPAEKYIERVESMRDLWEQFGTINGRCLTSCSKPA